MSQLDLVYINFKPSQVLQFQFQLAKHKLLSESVRLEGMRAAVVWCMLVVGGGAFWFCFRRKNYFYRTRVRSLAMLVTTSLTDCRLGNLIDVVTVIDVDDEK